MTLDSALALEPYWEAVRALYSPFEAGLPAPTGRVYRHEIPGGQLSNLRQQAAAIGVGDRFEEVEAAYERANALLGHIIKVTPTSKVVGDLAIFAVSAGIDLDQLERDPASFDLPDSVLDFLRGALGRPPAGFPQPFTERALRGRPAPAPAPPLSPATLEALERPGRERQMALAELMFPGPLNDYLASRERHGDVSLLPTQAFFYGLREGEALPVDLAPGVRVIFEVEAIGEADESGMRTVMARVNGQLRPVDVRDRRAVSAVAEIERADSSNPGHVAAPVIGAVIIQVAPGEEVGAGDPVAVIEAMKMESTITAPVGGRVERVAVASGTRVERGDLLLVLAPADAAPSRRRPRPPRPARIRRSSRSGRSPRARCAVRAACSIGGERALERRHELIGALDQLAIRPAGARERREVGVAQMGRDDAARVAALLVHADRPVHRVVDDDHDDRRPLLRRRRQFERAHLEAAVADEADDRALGVASFAATAAGTA